MPMRPHDFSRRAERAGSLKAAIWRAAKPERSLRGMRPLPMASRTAAAVSRCETRALSAACFSGIEKFS